MHCQRYLERRRNMQLDWRLMCCAKAKCTMNSDRAILLQNGAPTIISCWWWWRVVIATFPRKIRYLNLYGCYRAFAGKMRDAGPTREAYEAELGIAVAAGHMTTSWCQVDEQAAFRTSPDAGTTRNVIDYHLLCDSQDTDSWILSVASFVSTASVASFAFPLSLAAPAELKRSAPTAAYVAFQSYAARIHWTAPRLTAGTLLAAKPLTNIIFRQLFLDCWPRFIVEASDVAHQEISPGFLALKIWTWESVLAFL